ncbi:MAG: hypothetical protein HQK89_07745 [Nitrospirae bacterium]|nr:hypothetical protein [Nitrospirota bacterium]
MKVADMSTEDLKTFIEQTFFEIIGDPDNGLQLSDRFIKRLTESFEDKTGRMSHEDFIAELKKDNLV